MPPSENDLDYRELNICFSLYIEVYFWWCENHTDLCHFFQDARRHRFHFHSAIIKAHIYRSEHLQLVSKIHKGHCVSLQLHYSVMWKHLTWLVFMNLSWTGWERFWTSFLPSQTPNTVCPCNIRPDLLGSFPFCVNTTMTNDSKKKPLGYEMQMLPKVDKITLN